MQKFLPTIRKEKARTLVFNARYPGTVIADLYTAIFASVNEEGKIVARFVKKGNCKGTPFSLFFFEKLGRKPFQILRRILAPIHAQSLKESFFDGETVINSTVYSVTGKSEDFIPRFEVGDFEGDSPNVADRRNNKMQMRSIEKLHFLKGASHS